MILDSVNLNIDKQDYTTSPFNDKCYNGNVGNFAKHLKKNNITLEEYTLKYYRKYIPTCLESGEISDNKVKFYWNKWIPLKVKYSDLHRKCKYLFTATNRIKNNEPEYFTKYLTFEYWVYNMNYKLSDSYNKINYFINSHRDMKLYRRLSDSFYGDDWNIDNKNFYINKILDMNADRLINKWTFSGMNQRGNVDVDKYNKFMEDRYTIFRNKEFQNEMMLRAVKTFTPDKSPRCIEYWMNSGYTLEESKIKLSKFQDNNSIKSIMNRYNCNKGEAKEIQKSIYDSRLDTFNKKNKEELDEIYKKQDSLSMDYCMRKCNFIYDDALKLYSELKIKKVVPFGKASKESLRYFLPLYKYIRKIGILRNDIYFGINGSNEYFINDGIHFVMYDFTILSKKIIIEYDGEHWHKDSTVKDKLKNDIAIKNGFKIYRISSNDDDKLNKMKVIINENI